MKRRWVVWAATLMSSCTLAARAGTVNIDRVTVGDAGNEGEYSGELPGSDGPVIKNGGVDYTYMISKYELTNAQYAEFLNAVAREGDAHGLHNTDMGGGWNDIGGISRSGSGAAVHQRRDQPGVSAQVFLRNKAILLPGPA